MRNLANYYQGEACKYMVKAIVDRSDSRTQVAVCAETATAPRIILKREQ